MPIRVVPRIKRLANRGHRIELTVESLLGLGTVKQTVIHLEEFATYLDASQKVLDVVHRHMADDFNLKPSDYTVMPQNMNSRD